MADFSNTAAYSESLTTGGPPVKLRTVFIVPTDVSPSDIASQGSEYYRGLDRVGEDGKKRGRPWAIPANVYYGYEH